MKKLLLIVLLVVAALLAAYLYSTHMATSKTGNAAMGNGKPAIPVAVAEVVRGDIDVLIGALGSVVAHSTVLVKARVDGQLEHVVFSEGQRVKAGELLATIDPRPFQVMLDQANGQLHRDEALLANARIDLERYRELLNKDAIARQQVDAQAALVRQYEGVVQAGRAQVDNARLQLGFTRITAPLDGRLGLRQVDAGNMVRTSDTNGIVVITRTLPVYVLFSIPGDQLPQVQARLKAGARLAVEAYDRDGRMLLAHGWLQTLDNQIDPTTGTVRLKAHFANEDQVLFPNQFVNVRLRVDTQQGVLLMPTAAIQRATQGSFVYRVEADKTVSVRPVVLSTQSGELVAVKEGLAAGDRVVIDGADKLRQGASIEIPAAGVVKGVQGGAKAPERSNASNISNASKESPVLKTHSATH